MRNGTYILLVGFGLRVGRRCEVQTKEKESGRVELELAGNCSRTNPCEDKLPSRYERTRSQTNLS